MFQIYTVPNCKYCEKAKVVANEYGFEIEELDFYQPTVYEWQEISGKVPMTAPQIFVDGEYIGGCDDFIKWIESE